MNKFSHKVNLVLLSFAVICCLVIVRRVHIWSCGCRPCRYPLRCKYEPPDNYQTKIEIKMRNPHLSVGKSILLIHARMRITHCHVRRGNCQIVSRNLGTANENDGFKMTALEEETYLLFCLLTSWIRQLRSKNKEIS